jgi:hypothetical protein
MMGEDPNYEVHQSRSGHSQLVAPHAGPSGLTHDQVCKLRSGHSQCIAPHAEPLGLMHDHEDIIMDHFPSSISPSPDDGAKVYGLSNLRRSRRIADGVKKIGQQW